MNDTDTSAPFLSVFETPPASSTQPEDSTSTQPFNPQDLVAEFKAKAAAEREEQERVEREIQGKLIELAKLKRSQREQYEQLSILEVTEEAARHFPDRLIRLEGAIQTLGSHIPTLKERGIELEHHQQELTQTIQQLERFLSDTARERDAMITEFGGGNLGEDRYREVEQRTQRALEQHTESLTKTREQYEHWKRETADTYQEAATELEVRLTVDTLQSSDLDDIAAQIGVRHETLRALGNKTTTITQSLDVLDQQIAQLLDDKRITERLTAEESEIAAAHTAFAECVITLHGAQEGELPAILIHRLADSFFDIVYEQIAGSSQRSQTAGNTATSLSKSLITTLQKMKQQPAIDFIRLAAHVKAQLALQQSERPTLTQSTKGYNDLLCFGLMIGLIGNSRQAFEPFAIEHTALGGQSDQLKKYLEQRVTPFHPIARTILAAQEARGRSQQEQTQELWPTWIKACADMLHTTTVDTAIDHSANDYKTLVSDLSSVLNNYVTTKRKHAEQEVSRAQQRLIELADTQQSLVSEYDLSQNTLKESLAALSLLDDSLELTSELEKLVGQQPHFGLLPLARGNQKQREEIEQRSKLLLLKLPDLRRAAELVTLDLGQVDVTDPAKLKPQFTAFKLRLEERINQQRETQAKLLARLGTLVELFDQVILGDKEFDSTISSPWLPKEVSEQLFSQYRSVEQGYRQTIQTYGLRQKS